MAPMYIDLGDGSFYSHCQLPGGGPSVFIHLRYSAVQAVAEDLTQTVPCPCPNVPLYSAGARSRDLAPEGLCATGSALTTAAWSRNRWVQRKEIEWQFF